METFNGRPDSSVGRSAREMRAYDLLDSLEIEFMRVDHEATDNMETCLERTAVLQTRICKNLFLCNRQETVFYLLIMPADKQFKTAVVSKQLEVSRLSFASETFMEQLLDTLPGSASVLSLQNDGEGKVQLLVDRDLLQQELFACHPCENTSSLRFTTRELFEKLLPFISHEPVLVEL